jgi:biopolymer transport protein ExbB/TolQ
LEGNVQPDFLESVGLAAIVGLLVWLWKTFGSDLLTEEIETEAANIQDRMNDLEEDQDRIRAEEKKEKAELEARIRAKREQLETDRVALEEAKEKPLEDFTEEELDEVLDDLGIITGDSWA